MNDSKKKRGRKLPDADSSAVAASNNSSWMRDRRLRLLAMLIVGALAVGGTYWLVHSGREAPDRRFQAALAALESGDRNVVRLEMSALNGLPEYEPHLAYLEGELLVDEGRYEEALRQFETSAEDDNLRFLTLLGKGRALYGMGDFSAAEALWNQACTLQPDAERPRHLLELSRRDERPPRRFERALAALREADRDVVETELAALRTFPDWRSHVQYLQGAMQLKDGQPEDALKSFADAAAHPQLRARALVNSGEALFAMGRYHDGEKMFLSALEVDNGFVEAHRWLGRWYFNQGANDHAARHLLNVAALDPSDYLALRQMGLLSMDFEKYNLAVDYYAEALRRGPPTHIKVEICAELAESQIHLRRFEPAMHSLRDYDVAVAQLPPKLRSQLETNTNLPTARLVLEAECQYSLGQTEAAQRLVDQALQRSPNDLRGLILVSKIAQAQRDATRAVAALNQAVKAHPKNYQAYFQLAQAHRLAGDDEGAKQAQTAADELKRLREAFSKLHETAAKEPENVEVRFRLSQMALDMGLGVDTAKMWLVAALAIDPQHEAARQELTRLQSP